MGKELYTAIIKNGSIDEYDFSGKEYPVFYKIMIYSVLPWKITAWISP